MDRIRVAVSADFFSSFARLPRSKQIKVQNFLHRFMRNPTSSGINYEKIKNARDKNLHSVRIDREYRGIVLHPEKGNVYLLLWVGNHDEAYKWAQKKIVTIHPATGGLQVFEPEIAKEVTEEPEKAIGAPSGIFDHIRDRQLLKLGVPKELLPLVRSIKNDEDLEAAEKKFPEEALEALYMLAAGYSYEETLRELERGGEEEGQIDTSDFVAALMNSDSKRRFMVVEDDLELQAMLRAPLEKWRVFLHPIQRSLVERQWNGPVRVLGGAGTGKTVVALHRAKWLAQNILVEKEERILFTTFTRNLASDIQENLRRICNAELLKRIEVVNLDKWVSDFLKRHGYEYKIDYGMRTSELWQEALNLAPNELGLPPAFYRHEWEKVIQAQEIRSLEQYLKAPRIGRGVRLNRKARKAIWPVFQEYMVLLDEHRLRESEDAMRDARNILEKKGDILPYCAIIVDEAQDMSVQAFRLLRQMVPPGKNDLFIVGDAHQRIYRHKVVLKRCGINIRGRSKRLRINYRTTEENRRWAVALLKGVPVDDLDGGIDDDRGYKSLMHGVEPLQKDFKSFEEEVDFITAYLEKCQTNDSEGLKGTCLVVRTKRLLEQYKSALEKRGIETYLIRRSEPEDRNAPGVRLATMHRVKGLEFERVIIAGMNKGILPLNQAFDDYLVDTEREEVEIRERALLYVAVTRAKKEVLITSFGAKSPFIPD